MQIKSVIIDNVHYINYITFDINPLFFPELTCWNWGASYIPMRLICRQIRYLFIYFNGMSMLLLLFYALKFGNYLHCPLMFTNFVVTKVFFFSHVYMISRILGSIPCRVISKTQKMVLDATMLNTQHYKIRIKWSNPG